MFSKSVRNQRIYTAAVRAERAERVARRAEKAIERRDAAKREVEWLRSAPVKDGAAGEDLPTDEQIKAYVTEQIGAPADDAKADDTKDDDAQAPANDEDATNVLFTS